MGRPEGLGQHSGPHAIVISFLPATNKLPKVDKKGGCCYQHANGNKDEHFVRIHARKDIKFSAINMTAGRSRFRNSFSPFVVIERPGLQVRRIWTSELGLMSTALIVFQLMK